MLPVLVAVAAGGALGSVLRYLATLAVQAWLGRAFPYATLLINVSGSFLMGFLFILTLDRLSLDTTLRTGLLTGVLGGYTTFSTFSMESLLLLEEGAWLRAGLYALLSTGLGLLAAWFGASLARQL